MKKLFFASLLVASIFLGVGNNFVLAQQNAPTLDFFYSETCPHCTKEKEFLSNLKKEYPEIIINSYEVINSTDNQKILKDFYDRYKVSEQEQGFVPVTFIPAKYFVGFNDDTGKQIKDYVSNQQGAGAAKIRIPVLGEIDPAKISLPLLTLVLGTLDGFNPCAMWILVVLVSLLLGLKSRKKLALVGGVFIFAEGFLYFLMMAAWLNAFFVLTYVSAIRIGIGLFGITFGILRLRDFFTWKPGVCKIVEGKSEIKMMDRIKKLMKPSTVPATVLGVVALAFGVNLVEFFCSAGFPAIYTRILALQGLTQIQYYGYLILYNIFYMLDDFVVFGFAFFTLSRFDFSDRYNKYSTLVAGIMILVLGLLLIFRPGLLTFS